jgi:hypothetical protein
VSESVVAQSKSRSGCGDATRGRLEARIQARVALPRTAAGGGGLFFLSLQGFVFESQLSHLSLFSILPKNEAGGERKYRRR